MGQLWFRKIAAERKRQCFLFLFIYFTVIANQKHRDYAHLTHPVCVRSMAHVPFSV